MSEAKQPQSLDGPNVYGMVPEAAVAALIDHAVKLPASDLYIGANENHVAVSVRHLGIVRLLTILSHDLGRRCISYIKAMAAMDLAETRRPLDGRWVRQGDGMSRVDVRISTIPTLYGEDMTLRLLVCQSQTQGLDSLGLSSQQLGDLQWMLNSTSGLILVTGPTGSGKTTTLYACLRHLNDGQRKINTIEDPIEYAVGGLRQSQVNLKADVGFPELLRSILRQTPDVIMIGEIRDPITAETAVHAASSGQLVLATLHAPIAAAAVQTMLSLGAHPHFLSSSLLGVIAQRLVRGLCPICKVRIELGETPGMFEEIRQWLQSGQGEALYAAKGCLECHQTGYTSRTGVFEVMRISRELRRMIAEGQPTRALRQKAIEEGFIELRKSALLKVARGETSAEEVIRTIPSEYLGIEE
jgi:type II secretory ATPase GspE/PulE/Tfp pilus assembly ATPase PilB-like protein